MTILEMPYVVYNLALCITVGKKSMFKKDSEYEFILW